MAEQNSLRAESDSIRNSRDRNVATRGACSAVYEMGVRGWLPILLSFPASLLVMSAVVHFWPTSIRVAFVVFALQSLALLKLRKSAWLRVICTLPIKRTSISRLMWCFVFLPGTFVVAVGAVLAVYCGKASGADALLAPLEMFMISATLALAMPFLPLEIPLVPEEMRPAFWGCFAVIVYLLAGKYLKLPSVWQMDTQGGVILGILLICTIAAFRNRDGLLTSLSAVNQSKHPRKIFRARTTFASRSLARATSGMLPVAWVLFMATAWLWDVLFRGYSGADIQVHAMGLFLWMLAASVPYLVDHTTLGNRLRVYKALPLTRGGIFLEVNKRSFAFVVVLVIAICLGCEVLSWAGLGFFLLAVLLWLGVSLVSVWCFLVAWDTVGIILLSAALTAAVVWPVAALGSAYDVVPLVLGANGPWFLQRLALIDLGLVCLGLGLQFLTLLCNRVAYKQRREI